MPQIRPISDLRNNFAEISRIVHKTSDVVYLTKNGYGDMVVMSVELFEELGIAALLVGRELKTEATTIAESVSVMPHPSRCTRCCNAKDRKR